MTQIQPSPAVLKQFKPLDRLSEKELILLSANSKIVPIEADQLVFKIGSHDKMEYFLHQGTVELRAIDGRTKKIEAGSESSKNAIALLQPRKFDVITLSSCTFICVEQSVVNSLLKEIPKEHEVSFSVSDVNSGKETESIAESFKQDLETNNLSLPSFPDTALKIRRLVEDDNTTVKDIAEALINDPAMTAKILKTCNSALYRTETEITSCQQAVVRLGFNTTRQLVTIFAMKELFNSKNNFLKQKMAELWESSREVAAISYVLAKMTPGMDPEFALLAGLLQDIGTIPILNYIERYPQFMKLENKVDSICLELKSEIGGSMLKHWDLNKDLIEVAEHSEDWHYDSGQTRASYADIAIIAKLHSYIGRPQSHSLPPFDEIHSFKKIGETGLTPEQSRVILQESKNQIDEIKSLLGAPAMPVLA